VLAAGEVQNKVFFKQNKIFTRHVSTVVVSADDASGKDVKVFE